jgi:hypothetical protein
MIAHVCLYKLKPEITAERVEEVMSLTRVYLLRVPEVLAVRTGKRTKPEDPWDWFIALELESLDKLTICLDDPYYIKFREEVLKPSVAETSAQSFEMEPRKDVKYS